MSDESKVIDIRADMAKGKVFRISEDQFVGSPNTIGAPGAGPATDIRKDWEKWPRKVERYEGEIPINNGKKVINFPLSRACGVIDKNGKCQEALLVQRVMNFGADWDEHHMGMQLQYHPKDVRYYIYCIKHGPHPVGPPRWDEHGNPI